jgi:carboxylesterase
MPLLPGAEPYSHEGSPTGVLLCHGFTGCPQSLRPWAEHLAAQGHTVSLPLLPGHGTRWQDMQNTGWQDWYATVDRELRTLTERCERVFVAGLSMGGTLAVRLAARHGDAIAGVTVVNSLLTMPRAQQLLLPVARHVVPSFPGIASDIAKEGVTETAYPRVPLRAADSLRRLLVLMRGELPQVTQPLLVMRSRVDHVVSPADSELLVNSVSSTDIAQLILEDSYHVATLDHDAERVFAQTDAFISRLTTPTTRKAVRDGT